MQAISQTGRLINEDHDRTAALLNRLEAHLEQAEARGIPTLDGEVRALVSDLNTELESELGAHFDFEEGVLFPLIADSGGHEMVQHLFNEHETMRPIGRRLQRYCALALRDGFDEDSYAAFVHFGWDILDRLERHLQIEETSFLLAIEALMLNNPDLDMKIAESYRAS
ncbi:MAG TPA: hemerythrin domain-containing protein [Azospirillum sp.]|nr:hemerythrin domain-containing protein [Azospirillum sp.]